jgi:chromosome segregation ATPase
MVAWIDETYEAVVDDVDAMEEEVKTDDTNVSVEDEEVEDDVVEEAANAFGTAYYDAVASDDTLEDTEEEVEHAEDDLEEADDDLEEAEEDLEEAEEEIEQAQEEIEQAEEEAEQAMEGKLSSIRILLHYTQKNQLVDIGLVLYNIKEEAEQSYAMKYSGSANTYNILASITGLSIVTLAAVSVKKRIFPEKKSDVFLRMEDDNLSVLA